MKRKSILNKVIYLNLTMTLIVSTLFITSGGLYSNQLTKERYNQAHANLSKLNKDFQIEMHRLDTLLTLCLQDSSIILTLSDKLDSDFFLENAQQAASRLSLMRQSLPYAKSVFLFTGNSQQIVRDSSGIYTKEIFTKNVLNMPSDNPSLDISKLSDGLFRYNDNYALFIKNLYSHGYVAVQIDLNEFANINKTLSEDFLGYVIQNDGIPIIANTNVSLSDDELLHSLTHDFVTLENVKYYCASSPMQVIPYTGLVLINNDSLMQPLTYMKTIMWITFSILIASCFILMKLSYKIYLPLRKITSQFGDSTDNEIAVIEKQIHELLFEITTLKENSQTADIVPENIALYYLISGGTRLNKPTMKMLEENFPYYTLIALTLQNDSGAEDLLFASYIEKELTSRFEIKFMSITKYKFAIITKPEEKEALLACLEKLLSQTDCNLQLFAGIREYCMSVKDLYAEYKLAESTLECSNVNRCITFSYSEKNTLSQHIHLHADVRQHLFEYARNQAIPQLTMELNQLFYPSQGCTLSVFQDYYQEVLTIFEKACISLNITWPESASEKAYYNTNYMYQTLNDRIQQLFSGKQKQTPDMKQRMEEYILLHLSEPLTLDTVADAFSITPVYLSGWFRKNMDTNFLTYISAIRMERAKEMLSQPNPPKIYEVALAVGIENPATFIRQFKKHTGITPSQFQKNISS